MPPAATINRLAIDEVDFMSPEWAEHVRAQIEAGPDEATRARKIQRFWDWIEFVKPFVTCTWGLACRDLPGAPGTPNTILLTMEEGRATGVELTTIEEARSRATFLQVADLEGWKELMAGFDVGKSVMYRRLSMETGSVLLFFKAAYFWTESLACVQRVPTRFPA